jgi:hypothetical protein
LVVLAQCQTAIKVNELLLIVGAKKMADSLGERVCHFSFVCLAGNFRNPAIMEIETRKAWLPSQPGLFSSPGSLAATHLGSMSVRQQ